MTKNYNTNDNVSKSFAIGNAFQIMKSVDYYRQYRISDFEALILPAIVSGQITFVKKNENLIGFYTWAMLSSRSQNILTTGERSLEISEWRSGPHFWIMDVVAPSLSIGDILRVGRKLRVNYGEIHFIRRNKAGGIQKISQV